jgi:hypothetical protein
VGKKKGETGDEVFGNSSSNGKTEIQKVWVIDIGGVERRRGGRERVTVRGVLMRLVFEKMTQTPTNAPIQMRQQGSNK